MIFLPKAGQRYQKLLKKRQTSPNFDLQLNKAEVLCVLLRQKA